MATAKQIAARKRFAEMARSGKLAKMRRAANPARKAAKTAPEKPVRAPVKRVKPVSRVAANPAPKKRVQTKRGGCNPLFKIQAQKGSKWVTVATESSKERAFASAKAIAKLCEYPIRVWD
jgi:hypothetical protein